MTYKQALYFIGEVLSLNAYPERKTSVKLQLELGVNWDEMVRYSTGHMVFQAVYLNLKRADLLNYLPKDLVEYAAKLTQLNRVRNLAILKQTKAIQSLLNQQGIEPVFLKGTALLLENLYQDIGERMVGDIDFLVSEDQIVPAATFLKVLGYQSKGAFIAQEQSQSKHYPRLTHPNEIAALEIHWAVVAKPFHKTLAYREIFRDKWQVNGFYVPSYPHQAIHNLMNTQVNDKGLLYGKIMMRQMYDGFMLSFKPEVLEALSNFNAVFYRKNSYLKLIKHLFNRAQLPVKETISLKIVMWRYYLSINFTKMNRMVKDVMYFSGRFMHYFITTAQACYKKEVRTYLYRRLSNLAWYKQHVRSYKNRP